MSSSLPLLLGGHAKLIPVKAYSDMLSLFRNFSAIPIPLSKEDNYHIHPDKIQEEIARGTSVILTSNPRNPTGKVTTNPMLSEIQDICRNRATLIIDEFYGGEWLDSTVSSSRLMGIFYRLQLHLGL